MRTRSHIFGNILFVLGILVLLLVVYNNLPFPDQAPYKFLNRLRVFLNTTATADAPPNLLGQQVPRIRGNGLITSKVHHTGGRYHLWVWGVKPKKMASCRIKIEAAHAAVGSDGGFWLVAFADTIGNGKPDREIARSDFLTAETAGTWSSFEFMAVDKQKIFVGTAWAEGIDTVVFRSEYPWPNPDGPFENCFYHRISPAKVATAGPAHTNLRVSFLK
jgi:hypothetical protein